MNTYKLGKICILIFLRKILYESCEIFKEILLEELNVLVNLFKSGHSKFNIYIYNLNYVKVNIIKLIQEMKHFNFISMQQKILRMFFNAVLFIFNSLLNTQC